MPGETPRGSLLDPPGTSTKTFVGLGFRVCVCAQVCSNDQLLTVIRLVYICNMCDWDFGVIGNYGIYADPLWM